VREGGGRPTTKELIVGTHRSSSSSSWRDSQPSRARELPEDRNRFRRPDGRLDRGVGGLGARGCAARLDERLLAGEVPPPARCGEVPLGQPGPLVRRPRRGAGPQRGVRVGDECKVTTWEWLTPYAGETYSDHSEADIDHGVVPPANAGRSRASSWDQELR
jgi:hypothetical protein